jgi:hypothetical protein
MLAAAAANDLRRFRPSAIPDPAGSDLLTQVRSGTPPASQAPAGLRDGEVSVWIHHRTLRTFADGVRTIGEVGVSVWEGTLSALVACASVQQCFDCQR